MNFDESTTIRSGMIELVRDTMTLGIFQRVLFWSVIVIFCNGDFIGITLWGVPSFRRITLRDVSVKIKIFLCGLFHVKQWAMNELINDEIHDLIWKITQNAC